MRRAAASLADAAVTVMAVSALSVSFSDPAPATLPMSKAEEYGAPLKFRCHQPLRLQVDIVMDLPENAHLEYKTDTILKECQNPSIKNHTNLARWIDGCPLDQQL